jgi:1-acyl-sn-glycerol-3-phosphate acyltransferase
MQQRARAERTEAPGPPIPWVAASARAVTRLSLRFLFDVEHQGKEHVPRSGPAIIIGNHPTYCDPWLVGLGTRRWITWMAWDDAFAWPVVGPFIRAMGAFPVNLERPQPSTIKAALQVLSEGRLLGVFPEGGRSQGVDLDPPRRGAPRIALLAGVPVVPVTIAGARRAWPRERPLPRRGKVVVRFHPPIDSRAVLPGAPSRAREERLTELVVEAIRSALPLDGRPRGRR